MRLLIVVLAVVAILLSTVRLLSWSGQIETPLFRGTLQGQLAVGF